MNMTRTWNHHSWTPDPKLYEAGRPFPAQEVVRLFRSCGLLDELLSTPGLQVYEPGAGTGRILLPLASAYPAAEFLACELTKGMVDVLSARIRSEAIANVAYVCADAAIFDPPKAPGVLVLSSLLHLVVDWEPLLRRFIDQLDKGGVLCLVGEEGDLYDAALGIPNGSLDCALGEFFDAYREARRRVGIPLEEVAQLGPPWDVANREASSSAQNRGLVRIDDVWVHWTQQLRVRDLFCIVENRIYSSMFSVDATSYAKVVETLRPQATSDAIVRSEHRACLRVLRKRG
jgi:SAM-dependent methyltransferase